MIGTRSALPQRSPMPLIVPCTWIAPTVIAASGLAVATSQSLWRWMPSGAPGRPCLSFAARHAEGGDLSVFERQLADLLKMLEVLGIGERVAALDVVEGKLIKAARDEQLVLQREVDALALTAVAQGGVVDLDACHAVTG